MGLARRPNNRQALALVWRRFASRFRLFRSCRSRWLFRVAARPANFQPQSDKATSCSTRESPVGLLGMTIRDQQIVEQSGFGNRTVRALPGLARFPAAAFVQVIQLEQCRAQVGRITANAIRQIGLQNQRGGLRNKSRKHRCRPNRIHFGRPQPGQAHGLVSGHQQSAIPATASRQQAKPLPARKLFIAVDDQYRLWRMGRGVQPS